MKEYSVWLLSVMGVANPRTQRIISRFGGAKQVYDALTAGGVNLNFLKPHEAAALKTTSLDKSCELIEWCSKRGYNIIGTEDDDYPEPLRHIHNPPTLLFTQGNLSGLADDIRINVIGTRKPCEYSIKVAGAICEGLAQTGITIVSGMAVGLDKVAMSAALERGGRVVGVLACGIDVEYPRGSMEFRKQVTDSGGAVISELMPRDSTRPTYFHNRNRIMSGLSSGTLIVEAGERSGCHITALHALGQNRDLFCIPPHDVLDPRFFGVVRYLRDGAIPVFSHVDIVNEYLSDICERDSIESATPKDLEKLQITYTAPKIIKQAPPKADYQQLPEEHASIISALQSKKLTFDELVKKNVCDADKVYEILLDMELDGLVERVAGDKYSIVK
jgi:DNA processing protein